MDCEASSKHKLLERMLFDETCEPTDLPISLLMTITKDFLSKLEIGRGGFAVVYKGFLGNGATIAVKKLFDSIDMDETKYNQEVGCLMRVRHKNIVRFLGYCANAHGKLLDYEGKFIMADVRHRLLCFEYLSNGSLQDYITDASHGLEWGKRYKILKGICEGLCHLHELRIVHLDLKPTNVLLDDNMNPKISDFGLSRRFDENQTRTITSRLHGSLGYLAPEFYSGVITFKSDIYSLGVIFMEILTGQKGHSLVDDVLQNWRNRFEISSAETLLEQVTVCTEISMECMDPVPAKRPVIQRIIQRLKETERTDQLIISSSSTSSMPQLQEGLNAGLLTRSPAYYMTRREWRWKLSFQTPPQLPIFMGTNIEGASGRPLEIILVDAAADTTGQRAVLMEEFRVELVPLSGDFPPDGREDWSPVEFHMHILSLHRGQHPLLMGDVKVVMREGRATVGKLQCTDNPSWMGFKTMRIGARVVSNSSSMAGYRVKEAITEAFVVREPRSGERKKNKRSGALKIREQRSRNAISRST